LKSPMFTVVALWAIALVATLLIAGRAGVVLAPLFAICILGSVVALRRALSRS
jgi:hypothetical protein